LAAILAFSDGGCRPKPPHNGYAGGSWQNAPMAMKPTRPVPLRSAFRLALALALTALVPGLLEARADLPDAATLKRLSARFAPVELEVDLGALPRDERAALARIVEAAQLMDVVFLRQVWPGNQQVLLQLAADSSPLGRARLHSFLQNKGPWLRIDGDRAFLPGVGAKPPQAGFYPAGATKVEVEAWMKALPPAEQAAAGSFVTTVRRSPAGRLQVVPYSVEYQPELERAAYLLRQAAALTRQPTLRNYLEKRAAAFLSNDYYDSDVAWMKLEASIEPTIGPYKTYEDGWFNAKVAFGAFVTIRDDAETARLARFARELQDIENHLPLDPKYRNPRLGALAPIRVVNSLFGAGGNRGIQTTGFNLPDDERIGREMGTKRTLLKNVQEAKFGKVLVPLSRLALARRDQQDVTFEAFFTHMLMHELMHGLGPSQANRGGKTMTVRAALQETHSAIEEAKADIGGLYALQYLVDRGVLGRELERTMYTTFLASCFRVIRFGLGEAGAKAIAIQLNTLLDAGAFRIAQDGTFSVDARKIKVAVKNLAGELLSVQATGDKARAAALLRDQAVVRPPVQAIVNKALATPVDIEPRFVTVEKLLAEQAAAPASGGTPSGP
jgi:hypothetical protein